MTSCFRKQQEQRLAPSPRLAALPLQPLHRLLSPALICAFVLHERFLTMEYHALFRNRIGEATPPPPQNAPTATRPKPPPRLRPPPK